MKAERCQARAQSGKPCSARVVDGRHCAWHSTAPEWAEKRRQWSAEGGRKRSNRERAKKLPAAPLTAEEVRSYLGVVFRGVIGGKVEPGVGTAAANIARALMDVAKVAEVEQQVAELRRDMAAFAERRDAS